MPADLDLGDGRVGRGGEQWDWGKPQHEHDSDPMTVFVALALISLIIVIVFFVNFVYKNRRRPPRRRTRVKGIHRVQTGYSSTKNDGV